MTPTVGFIGLGIIGLPMAERLLEQRVPLRVWNRTASRADALVARGASRDASPRELAAACDVVITMVTDGPALEDITLRSDGIAAGLGRGKVHCDMSTIDPETARRLAAFYTQRGSHFVHAPVLGSKRAAASGTLLIFAGGAQAAREACAPVFAALGQRTWEWDDPAQATCTKLACNLLLAGMMEMFAESLVFAGKAGVEPRTLAEIISASALGAPMFASKGQTMTARNFTPNFYLRNMLKDLNLATAAAQAVSARVPAGAAVRDAFAAANAAGFSEQDYSAVMAWLELQGTAPA